MLPLINCLLIIMQGLILASDIGDPTDDELNRAFVSRPSETWGYYIRKEKSVRLMVLGGSPSVPAGGIRPYPIRLHNYVIKNISSTSYVLNRAIAGTGPELYQSTGFDISHLPMKDWPNVILFETFNINIY